jgi:hypothetical protein
MGDLTPLIEGHLHNGVDLGVRAVSGSCKDILDHREAMWTFVREPGVEHCGRSSFGESPPSDRRATAGAASPSAS